LDATARSARFRLAELRAILLDYQLDSVDVNAVFPGGRRRLKVRAFSDYLAARLGAGRAAKGHETSGW
jgi:hypothetical protein